MGWNDEINEKLDAVETRLQQLDGMADGRAWHDYLRPGESLADRVAALEAKVGEGGCCGEAVTLCPCIKCCTIEGPPPEPRDQKARRTVTYSVSPDISFKDCDEVTIAYRDDEGKTRKDTFVRVPEPQPGDRVKLRDVPVGRWCEMDWGTANKCINNVDNIQKMRSDAGQIWYAHAKVTGAQLVTLLPEDYQPEGEGKAEGVTLSVHGSAPVVIPDWARHVRVNSTTLGYHTTTEIEIKA